ncbi:MAG: c-type cytochrome [Alphaproteobacteria bacterium]|nr:c-type cytochrome [Alphaproteobacteria bacterium]
MKRLARTSLGAALWSGVVAASMAWVPPAAAESAKMIVMQGIKAGAPACSGCHGAQGEGQSAAAIPRLAGLDAGYLLRQLDSFADGKRKNGTMTPIASTLTQDERKAVAAYYAKQSIKTSVAGKSRDTATLALGGAIAESGDWTRDVPGCS